jgi:hypothetical protein
MAAMFRKKWPDMSPVQTPLSYPRRVVYSLILMVFTIGRVSYIVG